VVTKRRTVDHLARSGEHLRPMELRGEIKSPLCSESISWINSFSARALRSLWRLLF
jgi:hypothetical protein